MHAETFNAFVRKNASFEAFLYAHVGTELNGSTLTTVSVLARLGQDPWAKAASWATLPRAAAIEELARSIAQMPLAPAALAGSRDVAARLLQLLPGKPQAGFRAQPDGAEPQVTMPQWLIWSVLAVFIGLSVLLVQKRAREAVAPDELPAAIYGSSATTSAAPLSHNDNGPSPPYH